jgi:hypothetical protein
MSFPTNEVINFWFQSAHTAAVKAGGSVYVMEKRAEQEVVKDVIRWAYLTMLDELEDLNYPTSSRVRIRVVEMLTALYAMESTTEDDDEPVDDYNDDYNDEANLLPDEDEDEEVEVNVDPALALEVVNALIKALIDKK